MNFAKKCKDLRIKKAVTQEQMAAALNISSQAISKWENGLTLPDITLLPELSVYFGVTIDELFDITDDKHLARIQNMVALQETIDDNDLEYAQNFLLSQIAEQKNVEYCMQLLPALYNKKAAEYRKKAEYYAKEALARFPENHNNHANLNEAQQGECGDWNLDNHAERISYYKEFLKENPESKESLRWYFGALLQVGRCEEAAEVIDKLEALYKVACVGDADNGDNHADKLRIEIYRAQLLWAQGRQEEALARFKEIAAKYDAEWLAWNCAADAYAKTCRYDEAMKCYNRVMEVQTKPRYTDAPMAMAQICEITGDRAGAIDAWKRYIQVLNEDWDTSEGASIDYANKKIQELTGAY